MRNLRYPPRLERLEVRLAPALATRDIALPVTPTADTAQATSLIQALASNPGFGVPPAGAGAVAATSLGAAAAMNPLGPSAADTRIVVIGEFATGVSPFSRVLVIETLTPSQRNPPQHPLVPAL